MKVSAESGFLDSSEGLGETSFRMANNAHLFEILRSRMYERPLESTIRELIDNAIDSHRRANKRDVPIEIGLNKSAFWVKDFGVGMSPETITEVYSVYGESDKRSTNNETGGFGLGSKTPFSINEFFSVISVWEGVERKYTAYIDESGVGKIKLMHESKSAECNGVTIEVPVKKEQLSQITGLVWKFSKYRHIYGDATPKCVGMIPACQIVPVKVQQNSWCLLDENQVPAILMNGIPYEFSGIGHNLTLLLQIGDVDLVSNRESIHVTPKTKAAITTKYEAAKSHMIAEIQSLVKNAPDFDSVIQMLNNMPYGTTASYEWQGKTFTYPIHDESVQVLEFGKYDRRLKQCTDLREGLPFIQVSSFSEINPYQKGKLKKHAAKLGVHRLYIVSDTFEPPAPRTSLKDIPTYIVRKPRQKGVYTWTGNVRVWPMRGWGKVSISPTQGNNLYTFKMLHNSWLLPSNLYRLDSSKQRHHKLTKLPNWTSWQEYVDGQLQLFTESQIEQLLKDKLNIEALRNCLCGELLEELGIVLNANAIEVIQQNSLEYIWKEHLSKDLPTPDYDASFIDKLKEQYPLLFGGWEKASLEESKAYIEYKKGLQNATTICAK